MALLEIVLDVFGEKSLSSKSDHKVALLDKLLDVFGEKSLSSHSDHKVAPGGIS